MQRMQMLVKPQDPSRCLLSRSISPEFPHLSKARLEVVKSPAHLRTSPVMGAAIAAGERFHRALPFSG